MKHPLSLNDYLEGFQKKDRTILARAITLIESHNPDHQELAQKLIQELLPKTGKSKRIGISGTPGVGKSTFIEALGKDLTATGKSIAVLAVDPTSQVSGGSILGDKTRMNALAIDPMAFIRPSPSGETLGGVGKRTRESLLLCEAYGFDYVLVETVGVGQSETVVAQMVDLFIMLLQPGSGDDLQGIKRGILEMVDMVIVTKDDGDNEKSILKARHDYERALSILRHDTFIPKVLACSSLTKKGFLEVEKSISDYFQEQQKLIEEKRGKQGLNWMWQLIHEGLLEDFKVNISKEKINKISSEIRSNKLTPPQAAEKLLKLWKSNS